MSELTEIQGIGGSTAKKLKKQGITSVEELAQADPEDVSVPVGSAEDFIDRASRMSITSRTMADVLDEYEDQSYLTTGVDLLDEIMDGGWEPGTITLCYGKSGRGKTQLAFTSLVAASSEGPAVYLQTENQSSSIADRVKEIANNTEALSNIYVYEAYDVDDQYQTYEKIVEDHSDLSILIIDSFTAQFRVADRFAGRENLGERSEALGQHLKRIGTIARDYQCPVVLNGQVYPSPEAYGKGDNPWGGEKMKHFVSCYLRLSSGKGELNEASLENHPGQPEGTVSFTIDEDGIDGMRIE